MKKNTVTEFFPRQANETKHISMIKSEKKIDYKSLESMFIL